MPKTERRLIVVSMFATLTMFTYGIVKSGVPKNEDLNSGGQTRSFSVSSFSLTLRFPESVGCPPRYSPSNSIGEKALVAMGTLPLTGF